MPIALQVIHKLGNPTIVLVVFLAPADEEVIFISRDKACLVRSKHLSANPRYFHLKTDYGYVKLKLYLIPQSFKFEIKNDKPQKIYKTSVGCWNAE